MKGFYYNLNTCIGCFACQVACQDAHLLASHQRLRKVKYVDKIKHYVSMSCNHCENSVCVEHCPTGAMYCEEEVVLHNKQKCIGCGTCAMFCPYHAIILSAQYGWAVKCDSCIDLRKQGKTPVCVASCPTHSLDYRELPERKENIFGVKALPRIYIKDDYDEEV